MVKNQRHFAKLSGLRHYSTGKPCKEGHVAQRRTSNGNCVECERIRNNERYSSYMVEYSAKNRQALRATATRWQQNNQGKETAKRHTAKMKRRPKWLSKQQLEEIKDFYVMAKELESIFPWKQHVDHVIPLQGKTVSGLHVPWNLQIIPASWNISKGNRYE
jgi:hypothetical protein